ncbi:MAG: tRNA-(ms[2]io[6]A)-hydroxylase [Bacteroidota bacterium]
MKVAIDIRCASPQAWVDAVMQDFDSFLQDHADCERKASAMAMSLVAKYPDRVEIIPPLIETALEEMEHFRDVYAIMEARGVQLSKEMTKDPYIQRLRTYMKSGIEAQFLDRLLLGSVVECRGAERFRLIYQALEPGDLKRFYHHLWASEAKHGNIFVELALKYFPQDQVYQRLDQLMDGEAKVVQQLEIRPALH